MDARKKKTRRTLDFNEIVIFLLTYFKSKKIKN